MPQRAICRLLNFLAFALVSTTFAVAQSSTPAETAVIPANNMWQTAQAGGSPKHKLFLVTLDQPTHRQSCRVQSFTLDRIVCSRVVGGPRTYLRQQLVAIIVPGDAGLKLWPALGLNIGLGAAIWGTVVLAVTCPACAVATGIAALLFFGAAGAILIGDDQPDRLLYLAPGQQLSGKLGFVQS